MMSHRYGIVGLLVLASWPGSARAAQDAQSPDPRLLTGKLLYVAPMPQDMDQWIAQDLKAWNKYRVTANGEGVDFVMRTNVPEKQTRFVLRNGVPQPARAHRKLAAPSIQVVDWVSGRVAWEAEILDKKPRRDEADAAPGAHVQILAHGLSPDQLASKIVRAFREYVDQIARK